MDWNSRWANGVVDDASLKFERGQFEQEQSHGQQ
jgi:hypothetical protein